MLQEFSNWTYPTFQRWLLIAMRVAPVIFMMPLFHSKGIPNKVKAGLTLVLSLALLPVLTTEFGPFPSEPWSFGLYLILELCIGFLLGFSVRLVFGGLQLAGELVGFEMGFGMARVMDPQSGSESTVVTEFYYLLGVLLFLAVDGHHWFFKALVQSFYLLGPGAFQPQQELQTLFLRWSGRMFVLALQMVAPVLAVLMLVKISFGVIARMVPQVNLLMNSFPITIGLGLAFMGFSLDLFWPKLQHLMHETGRGLVTTLLPLMKP